MHSKVTRPVHVITTCNGQAGTPGEAFMRKAQVQETVAQIQRELHALLINPIATDCVMREARFLGAKAVVACMREDM